MNKKYTIACLLCAFLQLNAIAQKNVSKGFALAQKQTEVMLSAIDQAKSSGNAGVTPRSLTANGDLALVPSKDWCSGFFPGELWFLYQYSGQEKWLKLAKTFTAFIEDQKTNGGTHDMGFKIYTSVGSGYRLTKDPHYRDVIIEGAKTLSTRFNPKVGCIKSWDNRIWKFPVIIDNMMNLELLFEATKLSGDSSFYKIAVTHANTTMKNHFRANYSSYHVVSYDPETGEVLKKQTHQGYADESAWSRGQSWALYGYTMCYRETKDKAYLRQAENVAKFILDNPVLPRDLVPYWDYNAPNIPNEQRDVSAAAVMASALYELSTYSTNGKLYRGKADLIVKNLTDRYTAGPGTSKGFILLHSTGSRPANTEVDVPLSYADYYYLEALLRQKHLADKKPVVD
ncbi:glycoside hydrolase family 88 protein [Mucilaginibacter sp. KACC 22773]|nr:glycoside hydrolase family 88 protein [Mucilaginibacter sp. KACC 22773]WDF81454.1 glycoside hydrolase family 88 protein [Mucilaginibacter sp. KACC 22773]